MKTGYRPSQSLAIRSLCCDCRGGTGDGIYVDCRIRKCPTYKKMPYRKLQPDYSWLFGKFSTVHTSRIDMDPIVLGYVPVGNTVEEKTQNIILVRSAAERRYIKENIERSKSWPGFPAMVRAKCFECCGNFTDRPVDIRDEERGGRGWDCQIRNCPIYYWMPYRIMEPQYDWIIDLECNRIHEQNMELNCMSREEYIEWFLNGRKHESSEEDEERSDAA